VLCDKQISTQKFKLSGENQSDGGAVILKSKWLPFRFQQNGGTRWQEERQLAIDNRLHHQRMYHTITLVVDGGWSKKAHKHSYNAKSGVGMICSLLFGIYMLVLVH